MCANEPHSFKNVRKNMSMWTRKLHSSLYKYLIHYKKVQVGNDRAKAKSEKDSHSKNYGRVLGPGNTFFNFEISSY